MIKIKFLNFIPTQILFSSYKYGNAHWTSDLGIIEANSWENEDQLIENSSLSKHY
ncbi:hypothetical protein CLV96_4010 [Leptospira meyeri]|uniref:Uncharacterized protein n=1 Tax=Leptospira meyeri TaxID=29508 RepID=A0A4R8MP27_LEPME|nr:hypothetical protein CLV96_4010 [Leptospira meyeri]